MAMQHIIIGNPKARYCLIQAVDANDAARLQREYDCIVEACPETPVLLAGLLVDDWNGDLSPWKEEGVSRRFDFAGNADRTLAYILDEFMPMLRSSQLQAPGDVSFIIGGYSLAGLFSLWAASRTDRFAACAAASPSVWFPGWLAYARANKPRCGAVYLSLGDKEGQVQHPVLKQVADCIREQADLLDGIPSLLEWNEGTHFTDPDIRCAKGFAWCIHSLESTRQDEPKWEILSSDYIARRPWLTARKDVVRLPDGRVNPEYWVLEFPDWVNVIALTKDGRMVMERQYRHGAGSTCYELPCGVIEDGETPLEAAKRELLEETGYGNGRWEHLMDLSPNPSNHTNMAHTYVARDVELVSGQQLDATEDLTVHLLTQEQVKALLNHNQMIQALMVAPLFKFFAGKL